MWIYPIEVVTPMTQTCPYAGFSLSQHTPCDAAADSAAMALFAPQSGVVPDCVFL